MIDLRSMTRDELTRYLVDSGFEKYRASQVYNWLTKGATDFSEMTNLPERLRRFLREHTYLATARIVRRQVSKIDGTVKYLMQLYDGEYIESVLMRYHHGLSICISAQVGCKMGCTFCATGKSGYARDLTTSEMLAQIMSASDDCGERIANVVLMGMGEPFDNYENVMRFLSLLPDTVGIGMRHITISTCGIVPRIYEFADRMLQCGLSVSLHAPHDEQRSMTMPINRRYPIGELMQACRYYTDKTGRRITFEYALIDGVNDSDESARALGRLVQGMLCHINLIPVNTVTGARYQKSTTERRTAFCHRLSEMGVNATVRRTLGADIDASCGQLKRNFEKGDV